MASLTEVFNGLGLIIYPGGVALLTQLLTGDSQKSLIAGGLVAAYVYSQQK